MNRTIATAIAACLLGVSIGAELTAQSTPTVSVGRFTASTGAADDSLFAQGFGAMVVGELAQSRRIRVVDSAAKLVVTGHVLLRADSVSVVARIAMASGAKVLTDSLSAPANESPSLAAAIAEFIRDAASSTRGGGPVFRPPRPSIPRDAVTLYARAVVARAAGDPGTAVRFLRQALRIAPKWSEPRRQLAILNAAP